MKRIIPIVMCFSISTFFTTAQTILVKSGKQTLRTNMQQVKMDKVAHTGFESDESTASVPFSAASRGLGYSIGTTNYDLGSNGAVKARLINYGAKKLSGAFNLGTGDIAAGVNDRGSGYNTTDGNGKFGPRPTKRVEAVRTGFTTLCRDADGNEYLFAHQAPYKIMMSYKQKGVNTWVPKLIPSEAEGGVLWSAAAIGGANGKTIHVIALTAPTGGTTNGTLFDDINGALLYYRSLDGGNTWDKKDVALPGINGLRYNRMSSDAYTVVVKGDKVAIASFGDFYDTELWTSTDNGGTFTRKTVFDFPLTNYHIDDLYTVDSIPPAPEGLDPLAILSTDGSGALMIDNNNKVHLVVGQMYYLDAAADAGAFTYYPGTNGFFHWDENTPDSLYSIEAYPDLDEDGTVNLDGYGTTFNALTCHPSLAQGADNTIYLAYAVPSENYVNADQGKNCRHIFIMHTKDGGKNWSKPYDVIDDKSLFDSKEFLLELADCTFPYLAQNVDNNLHLIYQLDYTPGMHVSHPASETIDFEDNYQVYTEIPVAKITRADDVVAAESISFSVSPNPAGAVTQVSFLIDEISNVQVNVLDLAGRNLMTIDAGQKSEGKHSITLPLDLSTGMYFVQLKTNNKIATQKLIVK
ncbi:MAG: T9SS type A sorting domain-containing protein [Saprospiraceae bacterium]